MVDFHSFLAIENCTFYQKLGSDLSQDLWGSEIHTIVARDYHGTCKWLDNLLILLSIIQYNSYL